MVGITVLIGGVAAGILLINQPQIFKEKAAGAVNLSVSPPNQTKHPGDTFTFNIVMDTNGKSISGFDVRINFNPNIMQVLTLEKGAGAGVFTSPIYTDKIDNTAGVINYGYYTMISNAVKGSAVDLLKVTAKTKDTATTGTYDITFQPGTILASVEDSANALETTTPGKITVNKFGDINSDNNIDILDINEILKDYGNSPPTNPKADLDGSGTVNLLDINIILKNYGK